ncbi:MAG: hypothetical protein ABR577_12470 [Pyrinomonadaceae bacterium]
MPITPELFDELLKDYKLPNDMFGNDGLLQQLTKAVVERALQCEMTHHLGYAKPSPEGHHARACLAQRRRSFIFTEPRTARRRRQIPLSASVV